MRNLLSIVGFFVLGALTLPAGLILLEREQLPLLQYGLATLGVVSLGSIVFLGLAVLGSRYFPASVMRWAAILVGLIYIPMLFLVGFMPKLGYAMLDPGGYQISSLLLYSVPAEIIPMSFLLLMVQLWRRRSHREA